jgi:uncharacterized protein with PQ loop repeat
MLSFLIGFSANLCGIFTWFPIYIKILKEKNAEQFPTSSLILIISAQILWIIYALEKKDLITPFLDLPCLLICTHILYIKLKKN